MRFIFFKGLYSTLDLFTDEFERICRKRAYEYVTVHSNERTGRPNEGEIEKFLQFIKKPVTAAIGFGNMGLCFLDENQESYWDKYDIVYINLMMDHPFHFSRIFEHASKNTIFLCTDKNHVNYIRRFHKNVVMAEFLPHAGKESQVLKKPMEERTIDILYAGGLSRGVVGNMIPDLKSFQDFDGETLMEAVLSDLVKHPNKTTEEAIEAYLKSIGICYSEEELSNTIRELRFLDTYIVSMFREMTVKTLVESGLHVTLYGDGWSVCDWISNKNLDYKGVVPASLIPVIMQDAKIVLNTMTWFKDGSHDRIFNGMLAKAVVVTDGSKYMKEILTDGEEVEFFELTQFMDLPDKVKQLLLDEDRLKRISEAGYQKARKEHTWENRFDFILSDILPNFRAL